VLRDVLTGGRRRSTVRALNVGVSNRSVSVLEPCCLLSRFAREMVGRIGQELVVWFLTRVTKTMAVRRRGF
jgi:hypothetical protein